LDFDGKELKYWNKMTVEIEDESASCTISIAERKIKVPRMVPERELCLLPYTKHGVLGLCGVFA